MIGLSPGLGKEIQRILKDGATQYIYDEHFADSTLFGKYTRIQVFPCGCIFARSIIVDSRVALCCASCQTPWESMTRPLTRTRDATSSLVVLYNLHAEFAKAQQPCVYYYPNGHLPKA